MSALLEDIRYAMRLLARQPGFTAAALLLLALGIGINSAIFSVVDSVLLRPLPYRDPARLYVIAKRNLARQIEGASFSAPEFLDYSARLRSFSGLTITQYYSATLTGRGEPARVMTTFVSPGYFELLGITPLFGRTFSPEESQAGKDNVAILSEDFWRGRFGADSAITGQTMTLDGEVFTVLGVTPKLKGESGKVDMLLPKAFSPPELSTRSARYLRVLGRLKDGVSAQQAEQELKAVSAALAAEHPATDSGWQAYLIPAQIEAQGDARQPLFLLSAAVGMVLLITCSNLANLLLVRTAARRRELAVRSAMGASQARVFRQMLTESATLALAGGAAGLLVAAWSVRAIARWGPVSMPRLQQASIDSAVLGFTFLVSLAAGLLFGVAPAWQVLRLNLANTLRDESRGTSAGAGRRITRSVLVVGEVALSAILLVGAGLLLRTFSALSRVDPGFRAENVLTLRLTLPDARYHTDEARAGYVRRVLDKLETTPGVRAAGATSALPMMGVNWMAEIVVEGRARPDGQKEMVTYNAVTPRYFEAIGAQLKKGRLFAATDDLAAPRVILISEAMERRYFNGEDPLGRYVNVTVSRHDFRAQIVGVVRDVAHLRPEEPPRQAIYQPHAQLPWPFLAFAVRTAGDPQAMAHAVRNAFFEVDRELPVDRVQPLSKLLDDVLAQQRLAMVLLLLFSALAVVLAVVGLYGVLAVAVAQRGREIGIRMAVGAGGGDILRLVLSQGLGLTLAGLSAGLAVAPLASRVMKTMLYGVEPLDAITFAGVAVFITAAALAASYFPARRAMRVDPGKALRAE